MTDDLTATRDLLWHAAADATGQVAVLERDLRSMIEASRSTNADDEHDPEGATIAFERAQLSALLAAARRRVEDVTEAIARLDRGTYGRCTGCGCAIPPERLAARPSTSTCVGCADGRRHGPTAPPASGGGR